MAAFRLQAAHVRCAMAEPLGNYQLDASTAGVGHNDRLQKTWVPQMFGAHCMRMCVSNACSRDFGYSKHNENGIGFDDQQASFLQMRWSVVF